jgi:hypothetical protein
MNQCLPSAQVLHWGLFKIFQKLAEIFANEYLSPLSTTSVTSCSLGSGFKLLGDRSSHHYKDPSERGKEARDDCTCILKVGTNENGSACGRWLSIGIKFALW